MATGDELPTLLELTVEPVVVVPAPVADFTWTPSEAQGPDSYTFDVVVTDDGTPVLNDFETITVTVNEVNVAPILGAVGDQTVDEQTLLTFTATATDAAPSSGSTSGWWQATKWSSPT